MTEKGNQKTKNTTAKISASIMCADSLNLRREIGLLAEAKVDYLHADIMDMHFVPNMVLSIGLLKEIRKITPLPLDIHLMVDEPVPYIEQLKDLSPMLVTVHAEASVHLDRTLSTIRDIGAVPGVALNPATPIESIRYVLKDIGFVLLMLVNPGFAGQHMVPYGVEKVKEVSNYIHARGLHTDIMVDGNVSFDKIPGLVDAGATILVCGTSSLFHTSGTFKENADTIRRITSKDIDFIPVRE